MSKITVIPGKPVQPQPRFSWPARLLLAFVVFDIVFHSLASLVPYTEWMKAKGMARYPERLPTRAEITKLRQEADADNPRPLAKRVWRTVDSTWKYFKLWPDQAVRDEFEGPEDWGMFGLAWVTSRLDLVEGIFSVPQKWTMFSPNASRGCTVARFRLLYADGTVKVIRLTADPEDLTTYTHWFQEKILDCELKVPSDYDSRVGYCNYLAHQHPASARGALLERIYIYEIEYRYPHPGEDIVEKLRAQNGPPDWDQDGPFFVYDVRTKDGRRLSGPEREQAQAILGRAAAAPP